MHQTNTSDIPVYDVSGGPKGSFCLGVSNFTAENCYAALRAARILDRGMLFAKVHIAVYDHLNDMNQLSFRHDTGGGVKVIWREFLMTIDQESDCTAAIVVSELSDDKGNKVLLRTREF
jgi:hypothetical protein